MQNYAKCRKSFPMMPYFYVVIADYTKIKCLITPEITETYLNIYMLSSLNSKHCFIENTSNIAGFSISIGLHKFKSNLGLTFILPKLNEKVHKSFFFRHSCTVHHNDNIYWNSRIQPDFPHCYGGTVIVDSLF